MKTRQRAQRWAKDHDVAIEGDLRTSKYYLAKESRSRRAAWWVEIPLARLDLAGTFEVFCEASPEIDDFYHLVIPADWFDAKRQDFCITNRKISLWLSAEPHDLLIDTHPKGHNVDLRCFLKPLGAGS